MKRFGLNAFDIYCMSAQLAISSTVRYMKKNLHVLEQSFALIHFSLKVFSFPPSLAIPNLLIYVWLLAREGMLIVFIIFVSSHWRREGSVSRSWEWPQATHAIALNGCSFHHQHQSRALLLQTLCSGSVAACVVAWMMKHHLQLKITPKVTRVQSWGSALTKLLTWCFKFFCILKLYPYLGNGCCKNERFLVFYVQNISHFYSIMLIFQLSC